MYTVTSSSKDNRIYKAAPKMVRQFHLLQLGIFYINLKTLQSSSLGREGGDHNTAKNDRLYLLLGRAEVCTPEVLALLPIRSRELVW